MKVIATHQSSFLPYIGYWNKVLESDTFVYDTANDFSSNYIHRVQWGNYSDTTDLDFFTLPIGRDRWLSMPIGSITFENSQKIIDMIRTKVDFYRGKEYYRKVSKVILDSLAKFNAGKDYRLAVLNRILFDSILELFQGTTKIVEYTPDMKCSGATKTERLVNQLLLFTKGEQHTYLSGFDGAKYMESDILINSGIYPVIQERRDVHIFRGTILAYLMEFPVDEVLGMIHDSFTYSPYATRY